MRGDYPSQFLSQGHLKNLHERKQARIEEIHRIKFPVNMDKMDRSSNHRTRNIFDPSTNFKIKRLHQHNQHCNYDKLLNAGFKPQACIKLGSLKTLSPHSSNIFSETSRQYRFLPKWLPSK